MPLQVIMTEGLISTETAQQIHAELTERFLELHGLGTNAFMRPNVIGDVTFVPKGLSFSGGQPQDIAIVELRTPSFAFASQEIKASYIADATAIIHRATEGKLPLTQIWVNMVYAVDGFWGIGGKAYTNADLTDSIAQSESVTVAD